MPSWVGKWLRAEAEVVPKRSQTWSGVRRMGKAAEGATATRNVGLGGVR